MADEFWDHTPMNDKAVAGKQKDEADLPLVPRLRFPEFRDGPRWSQPEISGIAVILKGKGIAKADIDPNGSQACIRYGELYTRYGETIREVVSRTKVPASELFLSKPDDVIIPSSGETKIDIAKASCVLAGGIALGSDLNVIRSNINGTFLSYYLNGPKRLDIAKVAQGDTVVHLYPHQIETLYIAVPSPAEQQKIADCLSSFDDLITLEAQKLDGLKAHKKGLMQQLFPREGETHPRLRFPEFQNAGEWSAEILGDLSQIVRGGSPRPIDGFLTTAADGLNWLKIGDVDKEAKFVTRTAEKVRPEALSKTRVVHPGDLILSNSMSFGRPYILQIKTCIHDGWIAITHISNKTDKDFLYYSISAPSSKGYFVDNAAGSGVQNLNADIIKGLQVYIPTIPEQKRIASCLSSLDSMIFAESQKLAALKTHKKGLMQQLFPQTPEK